MSDVPTTALREQFEAIQARLDEASTSEQREAVKREIIALFKTVDQAIGELSTLKEGIRELVDRFKQL